jgi:hypothetical protein
MQCATFGVQGVWDERGGWILSSRLMFYPIRSRCWGGSLESCTKCESYENAIKDISLSHEK